VVKILFLGTGTSQGVPMIGCDCEVCRSADVRDQRFRSSVALFVRDKVWVIDTGPDFRMQALRYRLPTVDAILFTHAHKDHTAGLDDVRPYNYLQNKRIPLYADALAAAQLRREFSYAFGEVNYPGVPLLDLWEIQALSPFCLHGVEVWPLPLWHYKLPILGYRVGGGGVLNGCESDTGGDLAVFRGFGGAGAFGLEARAAYSALTFGGGISGRSSAQTPKSLFHAH
jgi:phosphoribosyl 1,2-cyclic phosphate phosphodiesterase